MNQTEIKAKLDAMEVIPSKKLGQNFLIDENVARWIVGQLGCLLYTSPSPRDRG